MPKSLLEPKVPEGLAELQAAFGEAMATPFLFEEEGFALNKAAYPKAIVEEMVPCAIRHLDAATRLSTYNRQYWFRLLTIMQKEYPLTWRLMGLTEFNKMVMAFLDAVPPGYYSLRHLSDELGAWLEGETPWSLDIIKQAVSLEFAFIESFDAVDAPILDPAVMRETAQETLATTPLKFQAHTFLFSEDWVLMKHKLAVRSLDLNDEYEVEPEEGEYYWMVYRRDGRVEVEELGLLQYLVLMQLYQGSSLGTALAEVADGLPEDYLTHMMQNIQAWFARWISLGIWTGP